MASDPGSELRISVVPAAHRLAVLRLIWPHYDRDTIARLLDAYDRMGSSIGERYWDGLIGSYRDDTLAGAVWMECQAGRVASLHGPAIREFEHPSVGTRLVGRALQHAADLQSRLVLALRPPDEKQPFLSDAGFHSIAELLFMHAQRADFEAPTFESSLTWTFYSEAVHGRFATVIEQTYIDSLDCPAIDGLRPIEEIIATYRATGDFEPRYWLIASVDGPDGQQKDVGCLLLARHAATGQMELMYMGVVAGMRGHGYGRQLLAKAQEVAREANSKCIVLAVDRANVPGVQLYQSMQFAAFDVRRLWLRVLEPIGK